MDFFEPNLICTGNFLIKYTLFIEDDANCQQQWQRKQVDQMIPDTCLLPPTHGLSMWHPWACWQRQSPYSLPNNNDIDKSSVDRSRHVNQILVLMPYRTSITLFPSCRMRSPQQVKEDFPSSSLYRIRLYSTLKFRLNPDFYIDWPNPSHDFALLWLHRSRWCRRTSTLVWWICIDPEMNEKLLLQ